MTYFDISGNVGRVVKKIFKGDKKVTFISVASVSFYNKESKTTWINNIAFYGTLADVVANIVTAGVKIRVSGIISVGKKGNTESVFFVGEKFEIQAFNEERRNKKSQEQAVNNLPDDEDMYLSGGGDKDMMY